MVEPGQVHDTPLSSPLSSPRAVQRAAWGLALAAAVSLGLSRFAYTLLLPPMRDELGWSFSTAGAMNTVNAAGYLLGALLLPRWQARHDGRTVVLAGGIGASVLLALHGWATQEALLLGLRLLSGMASAASFAGGGLLAARLAQSPGAQGRSGFILGLYYGGTGVGIVAASLLSPTLQALGGVGWRAAWVGLGLVAALATGATARLTLDLRSSPVARASSARAPLKPLGFALAGYLMFGLGYIGYMTFIIALLREQGLGEGIRSVFYAVLGLGVMASSRLWAGLLQRHRDGRPMAVLNGMLAVATAVPILWPHPVPVFASGALFGSVFLSVVASTTALVRHNLPATAWPSGIAAFTTLFAAGQIVGPLMVGWVSDAAGGGLATGFILSAGLLALGAALAAGQRPLGGQPP